MLLLVLRMLVGLGGVWGSLLGELSLWQGEDDEDQCLDEETGWDSADDRDAELRNLVVKVT